MKIGSLVEWNGNPQDHWIGDPIFLVKGNIYVVAWVGPLYEELPDRLYAKLEENGECNYSLTLLREVQPPQDIDIQDFIRRPEYA